MTHDVLAPAAPGVNRARLWLGIVLPLVLLAAVITMIVKFGPAEQLRDPAAPPVENLSIRRALLEPHGIVLDVLNDGPETVTIAQVTVDDAYWQFTQDPPGPIASIVTGPRIAAAWLASRLIGGVPPCSTVSIAFASSRRYAMIALSVVPRCSRVRSWIGPWDSQAHWS